MHSTPRSARSSVAGVSAGVLRDEAAGDGGGEDGFSHALEELADGSESGLAGVELGERLLDRRDDPLLLGQRGDRDTRRRADRSSEMRVAAPVIALATELARASGQIEATAQRTGLDVRR